MKIWLAVVLMSMSFLAQAQPYGDEWVNFDKQYWRIPVAQDGIYRITFNDLQSAGFPVSTLDPRRIQLYHQGNEQAIFIEGQGDASFDPTDFVLFFGEQNDGELDADLYRPASFQPHQLYSIYTDTAAYFLTYSLNPAEQGRRMSSYKENNTGGLPAETSAKDFATLINTEEYAPGFRYGSQGVTRLTWFDQGEGWTGDVFQEGQNDLGSLVGISQISSDAPPELEVLIQGRDELTHVVEIFVGPDPINLRNVGSVTFEDYVSELFTATLSTSDISPTGELFVDVRCVGLPGANDLISVSYLRLEYSRTPDLQTLPYSELRFQATSGDKVYIEVENVPTGLQIFDVSEHDNPVIVGFNELGSEINAVIRNADSERRLWFTGEILPVALSPVQFRNFDYSRGNYILISNALLRSPALGYQDPVQAFAAYRASAEGGAYDTVVVNMRTLYDQFSYGITSSLAVYNFMRKFVNEGNPEYLFLVGKGLEPQHDFHRNPQGYFEVEVNGATYRIRDLVPSAGNPGADITYTAGLNGTIYEPAVATGRIPAVTSEQVAAYLEKVREMEAQPYNDLYRKSLLHLSGGITPSELIAFRRFMDGFGAIAENPFLGGEFTTIQKDNTNIIELINISEEVNNGVGLVTFFGHSAPSVTDIDIGFVTDPALGYNNLNKYPMFLVNGCQAGQFFLPDVIFGEDWINARDLGAIGFIAHSSFGFASALRRYTDFFYRSAFEDSVYLNKPIGDIQIETGRKYQQSSSSSTLTITQIQQMVLLGDPATPLFNAQLPDYQTSDAQLSLVSADGTPVTGQTPELVLQILSKNFGRTQRDSIEVSLIRTLSNGVQLSYDSIFTPVLFQDTLRMVVPNDFVESSGNNEFFVTLDPLGKIDELNENNNTGRLQVFIPSFATQNLFPVNYALTPETDITFIAQSTDFFGTERSYSFEIDTLESFDSPVLRSEVVTGSRLARYNPGSLPTYGSDSITYFWRTRYTQPNENESDEWQVSSFSIVSNSGTGWTQRVYGQFNMNSLEDLVADPESRRFEFETSTSPLSIFTAGGNNPLTNQEVSVQVDEVEYNIQNQYCRDNTLNFIAYNRNTAVPYLGITLPVTDSRTCGRQPQIMNSFSNGQINAASLGVVEYVASIPDGDIVVIFSIGQVNYSIFNSGVETALNSLGLSTTDINDLINGEPVIIIGRKGATPGTAALHRAQEMPADEQELSQDSLIVGSLESGVMNSRAIGPASNWETLSHFASLQPGDELRLDVIGETLNGNSSTLFTDITSRDFDLSTIDASQYPYLRLQARIEDPNQRTAPQLSWWQVTYAGVPEGILIPETVQQPRVQLPEGATLENTFNFVNISAEPFTDSLQVDYRLFNPSQQKSQEQQIRIPPPLSGDSSRFSITTSSQGFSGLNDYSVNVNPALQPEQYYSNNRYDESAYLLVQADNIDPVIDVVFDGAYILDGDIVSPEPLISIKVQDENEVLLKQDTIGITLLIKENCETCVFRRIPFSSPYVEWFPATDDSPFRIEYKSPTLGDGMYTFSVQATDASGNEAGEEPYLITFEVVNESTITNFYPYPNPFSTSTRFVFTLTGSYVPEGIKIQILTVTGRVVREIMSDELGPIRIGNNISEYAWDGRDEYGDQLANGVYLYRVILDTGSNSIEHRATAGDKGFDKGFGKLYILR